MKKTPADILLHMCSINEDHMIYGSKDIRHDGQSFLSFWVIFAPFPSEQPKKSKFWKNGKNPEDIIILHLCCTTNDDHILTAQEIKILKKWKKMLGYMILLHQKWKSYDVWFLRNGVRHSFLSFWAILCPFTPLKIWKIKILKEKKKKTLEDIIILHLCTTSNDQMIYGSWDIKSNRQNFLSCWAIFCPFIPITTRNLKKWKKPMEISSFYTCVPQMAIIWCMVSEKWSMTDRIFCLFGTFFGFCDAQINIPFILKIS